MTDTLTTPDTTADTTADTTTDTDSNSVVTEPAEASRTATAPGSHEYECIDVDPTTLIIGDNVRAAAHLDRQFLASLREHGVMNPIQATRDTTAP